MAAGTTLAFTLEASPGAPALAAQPVTIPAGTRVQSVPDPDQTPQTFETVAAIVGRVEWNAIPAAASQQIAVRRGLTELYLAGTNLQLQQGDAIAIVASRHAAGTCDGSIRSRPTWPLGLTRVRWTDGVG